MRLSTRQITTIKQTVTSLLGSDGVQIFLFGSRLNDDAKGGDIDLLIETAVKQANRASMASKIMASLQIRLGDQHIDVLLVDPNTTNKPIHEYARHQGQVL